ncbi:hypothetical protein D9613_012048 [Agrocybe pediades]|uniref:KOW domain-containing protein n=1 Tax=Agrocybe pediades TaxID=84607 RepID=A0A8H4QET8_9AGAR|nr:hypothetical protein D9613_012048 [Agrocybe pediades]
MKNAERNAKRRRIQQNPFLDIEAVVDKDNEEDQSLDSEDDGFIVDDSVEIDEDDVLHGDEDIMSDVATQRSRHLSSQSTGPEDDEAYSAFLARARARASAARAQSEQLGSIIAEVYAPPPVDLYSLPPKTNINKTWVRIRPLKGALRVYSGDLALAVRSETYGEVFWLYWLVPRIRLSKKDNSARPEPALFNAQLAMVEFGDQSVESVHSDDLAWNFQGFSYSKQGYLIEDAPAKSSLSFGGQVIPTIDEFKAFASCEALDEQLRHRTQLLIGQNAISRGDRVMCIGGELRGLIGTVLECYEDRLDVHLENLDIDSTLMRIEVRRHFRVGDRVTVSLGDGDSRTGRQGWVTGIYEESVCVFDPKTREEMMYSWQTVQFDTEEIVYNRCLPDLRRSSTFPELLGMSYNPNRVYHKKRIMVVGAHRFKGITGIIVDTTLDGYAFVSLDIFNHSNKEKVKITDLQIVIPGNKSNQIHLLPIAPQENMYISTISTSPSLSPDAPAPQTPMTSISTARSGSLSDAWNPSARTPLPSMRSPLWSLSPGVTHSSDSMGMVSVATVPETLTWICNPVFATSRVKLRLRSDPMQIVEMRSASGDVVTVRQGMLIANYPLADVDFVRAEGKLDPVVSFSPGALYGKIFKIKEWGTAQTIIYDFGKRPSNKNTYCVATNTLAVVFPPLKS